MLRPPEKGGPSPTPDRGPLVTPACPLSANPEAAISIVGNSADLTRMMQRLLLDDTVARAVASLLPSGAQELSIRETKTTAPKGEQTNRGFSIEVPAKIRSQQLRDVVAAIRAPRVRRAAGEGGGGLTCRLLLCSTPLSAQCAQLSSCSPEMHCRVTWHSHVSLH